MWRAVTAGHPPLSQGRDSEARGIAEQNCSTHLTRKFIYSKPNVDAVLLLKTLSAPAHPVIIGLNFVNTQGIDSTNGRSRCSRAKFCCRNQTVPVGLDDCTYARLIGVVSPFERAEVLSSWSSDSMTNPSTWTPR